LSRPREPSTTGFGLSHHRAQPTEEPDIALTHRPGRSTRRSAVASTLQGGGSWAETTGEVLDDGCVTGPFRETPAPFTKSHRNYQTKGFTEVSESRQMHRKNALEVQLLAVDVVVPTHP